jgi:hypothetical protein
MLMFTSIFFFIPYERASAGSLTHNVGNLDFELTDYGRILGSLSWMGVQQTPMFQASVPPFGSIDEDSWIGMFDNQNGYDQVAPDIADPFSEANQFRNQYTK